MGKLLHKEFKLSASALTYWFIAFGLIAFFPGYPILMSAFFVSFGIFQTFQSGREANDMVYCALLPVSKADIVKNKYAFSIFIEMCGFLLMAAATLLRMTWLADVAAYRSNALMNANFVFLGFALLIFGCFNMLFIGGFFRTAYYYGKPFIAFIIAAFVVTGIAETLHHIPGLEGFNAFGFEHLLLQLSALAGGLILYIALTGLSLRKSIKRFEQIDL